MLNLLVLYVAFLISILTGSYFIYIQNYKCLGMQTLYDYVLNNVILDTILCFGAITLLCTLATFVENVHPAIAKLLMTFLMVCTVHNGISLVSVAVIRYLLVFHGTLFYSKEDQEIMKLVKIINITVAAIMTFWDVIFIFDFESSGIYQSLVMEKTSTHNGVSTSMKLSFSLVIMAFGILQVRLEIQNYKFGEGFVSQVKRWWTDSHQDENHENEEFGVNFQRIMSLMLLFCFIFFFSEGVIHFKEYRLFGYLGIVPPGSLIQVIIVDLLWIMIIIQHPIARKKLTHFLRGTHETVQIIRM